MSMPVQTVGIDVVGVAVSLAAVCQRAFRPTEQERRTLVGDVRRTRRRRAMTAQFSLPRHHHNKLLLQW